MGLAIIDLSKLPEPAKQEVYDFYEFILKKYLKQNEEFSTIDWDKIVPRKVKEFIPFKRDEIYA